MKLLPYKTSLIIALIFIAVFIIVFGMIFPLVKNIKAKSADMTTRLGQIDHLYDDWFSLKSAEKALKKIDEKRLEGIFINPDQSLDFILSMENIIKKNGLIHEIKALNPSSSKLPFQIIIFGSFPNLMSFLADLENLPYFTEVNSFQIYRLSENDISSIKHPGLQIGDIRVILNINVKSI